ncbi:MAG: hypothetical protein U5O16_14190 [Rhodococcus sp. (in: high G+C Gram-positive bacteria)]|uniref:hypothetical protein n=1 Tax=Rhodococcus sp. TaxID=1831 RepID=UPI002ADACB71|nr:hypothetical protein [Rhodococcus sp. (in: high G+C Gram-positive bacteria)]
MPTDGPFDQLVTRGGRDAAETKRAVATRRADLARTMHSAHARHEELRSELERRRCELEADFARQRAELDAQIAPMKQQLARMQEMMWTVDLYLGRDEHVELIRDGAPAAADTPITIRQRVLVMAEESLVLMDRRSTGMDARDLDAFTEWITADPANLDRVLPEQRGVVVLIPTRVRSDSGNAFEDEARDAENSRSWWLLRNGEKLYLLTADITVGDRVLPRRAEFVEVFDRRLFGFGRAAGEPLVPGSDEWMKLERQADARRRHYMRIMLVLQGIVERTPVWHPLPPAGVNLLTVEAQDSGTVVLIQDDETSIQLGDGRESFGQWQRRLNAKMRPGMRIIGDWHASAFDDLRRDGDVRYRAARHPRLHPRSVGCVPESGVPHLIEDRRDGGVIVRYTRTDTVWKRDVPIPDRPGYVYGGEMPVTPSSRASCLVLPTDSWVLPFDLATREELQYYLNSRDDRSAHFLTMVPTLRSAIAAKDSEAQAEGPFRVLLAAQLIDAGAEPETVDGVLDELVHWWKLANTWAKPLNGNPTHEGRAVRQILAEYRSRRSHDADPSTATIIATGRAVPGAVCVARNRKGAWHVYAASSPAHDPHVFLDITPIDADGTLGTTERWQHLPVRSATLLRPGWAHEDWERWNFAANPMHYLTGPEREAVIAEARAQSAAIALCITETHDKRRPSSRQLISYSWTNPLPPEETPLREQGLRNYRNIDDDLITARTFQITKDRNGVHLTEERGNRYGPSFVQYSASPDDPSWPRFDKVGIPWWPESATRYGDVRARLAWADVDALARVDAWTGRVAAAAAKERERAQAENAVVDQYVKAVSEVIRAEQTATARKRFDEDYGTGAEDLWQPHLETLKLGDPIHPRNLWGLISIARAHDHPVEGQTLSVLDAHARSHRYQAPGEWHPGRQIDLAGFGHVEIPCLVDP